MKAPQWAVLRFRGFSERKGIQTEYLYAICKSSVDPVRIGSAGYPMAPHGTRTQNPAIDYIVLNKYDSKLYIACAGQVTHGIRGRSYKELGFNCGEMIQLGNCKGCEK